MESLRNDHRSGIQYGLTSLFVLLTYAALFQFAFARLLRLNPEAAFWTLVLGVPHSLVIAVLIWAACRHGTTTRRRHLERPKQADCTAPEAPA